MSVRACPSCPCSDEDPVRGHHRPLSVRRRHLVLADVPARPARARPRGLLHRGHRRVRLRPGAEHARDRSRLRHDLHSQRARAVRPRRPLVVRQLRRQLSRPERRTRCAATRPTPISSSTSRAASWFWRDEYARIPRKVFIDSDPAFTQLAIAKAEPWYVAVLRALRPPLHVRREHRHAGVADSDRRVRLAQDLAAGHDRRLARTASTAPRDRFTTVMTWQIESFADVGGNKDQEFVKFIDLPSRTPQRFELAINGPQQLLRAARLGHGGRDGGLAHADRVPRLHPGLEGGVRRRQAHLRRQPVGLVQRSHRVLSRVGPPGARAGHRLDRAPAVGRRSARLLDASTRRSPASTASTATTSGTRGSAVEIAREHFDARVVLPALLETACA